MTSHPRSSFARLVACALVFAIVASHAPRLAAAGNDADAGTWRMVVMTSPAQIPVAPPTSTSSAEYQAELTALKAAQGRLTRAQQRAIEYWGRGGVVRWNEIMLEMVSRADLPPPPNADGTYSVPDANNPFAEPQFPFGNPPYAARAYSYVSVAQFDALKAAWHFKYLYNRPSPSDVDGGVRALLPTNGLPSYPSEDAVLSGVTAELLKLLFPTNVEEINRKAAEQREAALLSGRATASDLAAGLALGNAVAALFTARAATDGMRTAGGSPALFAALAAAATARGEIPWRSLESPPRPPMLAAFGSVRAWMMTPADILNERPAPPPSTSSALMAREVEEVRNAVRKPTREQIAIVYKWADGLSTPTPPGHWNVIAAPYIAGCRLQRGAYRAGLRAPQHEPARRRGGLLGRQVRLLQPAAIADGSAHPDDHRPAELPVLYLRTLDVLGGRGGGAVLPVPVRGGRVPCAEGRSGDLAALRRDPLPLGHRDWQGPRQPGRRLHGELRPDRRRRSAALR